MAKIREINRITDGHCAGCTKKAGVLASCPPDIKPSTYVTTYCIKSCAIGQRLQSLGEELTKLMERPVDHSSWQKDTLDVNEAEEMEE